MLLPKNHLVVIGCVYIPPENSIYASNECFDEIENEMIQFLAEDTPITLIGDFNARTSDIPDFTQVDDNLFEILEIENDIDIQFNDHINLTLNNIPLDRFTQDIKHANYYGNKLLNMCRKTNMYITSGRFGADRYIGKTEKTTERYQQPESQMIHKLTVKWKPEKVNVFKENVNLIDSEITHLCNSLEASDESPETKINRTNEKICELLIEAASKSFGYAKKGGFNKNPKKFQPWFSNSCKEKRNKFYESRERYKQEKNIENRQRMKQSSKDYKREINKSYSKYQFEMEKEIRNTSKTDSRQFWKILNKLNGKNESEIKASLDDFKLFAYFRVINEGEDDEEEFNTSDEGDETFNTDILNENISEKEIEDSIRNLKNNKAKGFDDISNEYIKHSINIFMPLYVKLFNLILNTGKIPKAWGYGIIHPIYKKKGDPKNPESYRPITLTSALGKVFTSIIDTRLRNFANSQETISMAQAGFRKGFSTTDNIFCLYSFIQLYLNCGKTLFCTFIDFKKAFDTVWRIGLWQKLQNTNIKGKGKIFKVIYNMYKDIKSCVRKNSECSEFFPCMTGVRQGENLSPFLFTIFLNDIEEFLTHQGMTGLEIIETKLKEELHLYMKIFLLLYADDTVILADTPENLQLTLKAFERYCEHWKLKINVDKTKVLIFEKRRNRTVRNFFLNEIQIEVVDSYCYLGILFNYNGNFLKARNHLVRQAEKALYSLYTKLRNISIPIDLQLKLFDSLIAPIPLYSSEIWGFENKTVIEKIHLKFLKYILKLRLSTPNYMVYGETGREPMEIKIKMQMLSFWSKLLMNGDNKLSGILYQLLYSLNETGCGRFKWIE
ncbi:hypothetical protein FSP39_003531 [Pinctada imbricata]|uniref:Reverse transcriptase domain-containing protein n=1 Tax=Pinctada imbricata TaxID=66713 RepID=A0AA88Y310_PINIB|nr:hypothetical protein FSP39_003531 [Pinctada imbricata]